MKTLLLLFCLVIVIGLSKSNTTKKWCCFYDQHYHNCYSGKDGCILSPAIESITNVLVGSVQIVKCSTNLECPVLMSAGFFLRGFQHGCLECQNEINEINEINKTNKTNEI